MQIDTWYDLAVRELSELTDHAKEMINVAEKGAIVVRPAAPEDPKAQAEPPAQAA